MKLWFIAAALLLTSCVALTATTDFPLVNLQLDQKIIQVQLAATPELRAKGLMFQQAADPGMLLLYTEPQLISLWMRNTSMPLDVAFIDANWRIHHFRQLEPYDETSVPSEIAVIAALEMPRGWFAANQLAEGAQLTLLDH